MPFEFTEDRRTYFNWQYLNARKAIVPFVRDQVQLKKGTRVLEVGCNDGGVLKAFTELGCFAAGIDIYAPGIELAKKNMAEEVRQNKARFVAGDIHQINPQEYFTEKFDLIILKDAIEHIPDQAGLLKTLGGFLNEEGCIFIGYPPWQMPFGGHQQGCRNRFLARLPYFHLLPSAMYKSILKISGEDPGNIKYLLDTKDTGLSIESFKSIVKKTDYQIVKQLYYFINPIYEYKFGLKPRPVPGPLTLIPYLRNFYTTAYYALIKA